MMISNDGIDIAFDATLLLDGIKHSYKWYYHKIPHGIIIGNTGSGKTSLLKLILGKIGIYIPDASVLLCDYKSQDFSFLRGEPNYYEFTRCNDGLEYFYNSFLSRQNGEDLNRSFLLLVFDEFMSFINMLEKKEADAARMKLSNLLLLGRSYNVHVLVSQQRADAEYFAKARDNFGLVIALGNISKESAAMFNFDRDKMEPVSGIGCGYILTNGTDMRAIRVPLIRDQAKVEKYIRKTVSK